VKNLGQFNKANDSLPAGEKIVSKAVRIRRSTLRVEAVSGKFTTGRVEALSVKFTTRRVVRRDEPHATNPKQ